MCSHPFCLSLSLWVSLIICRFSSPLCLSPCLFPSSPTSHEMVGSLDLAVRAELVEVVPRVPGGTLILAWHWGFRMPHTARVSRWKAWRYASSSLFRTLEVQTCKSYSLVTSCLMTAPLLACGTHRAGANERCHPEEMWLSLSSLFPVRWQSVPCLLAPHCILVSQVSISQCALSIPIEIQHQQRGSNLPMPRLIKDTWLPAFSALVYKPRRGLVIFRLLE